MDVIAILGLIGSILIPLFIFFYQERKPKISVKCRMVLSGDPSAIEFVVSNKGRIVAEDIYIGFSFMLLNEMILISSSDIRGSVVEIDIPIQIHKLETPTESAHLVIPPKFPNPNLRDIDANHVKAFAIQVKSVPAKTDIAFRLITNDKANQRAARQGMLIRDDIIQRMSLLVNHLEKDTPQVIKRLIFDDFVTALNKLDCFYKPSYFNFSGGRKIIEFVSKDEIKAIELMEYIFKEHNSKYPDIFKNQKVFIAPVIRYRIDNGTKTTAVTSPFGTKVSFTYKREDHERLVRGEDIDIPIPQKYDFE